MRNMEVPDQTASSQKQSDLGLSCLSWSFCQAASVRNFRTFTVHHANLQWLSGRILNSRLRAAAFSLTSITVVCH